MLPAGSPEPSPRAVSPLSVLQVNVLHRSTSLWDKWMRREKEREAERVRAAAACEQGAAAVAAANDVFAKQREEAEEAARAEARRRKEEEASKQASYELEYALGEAARNRMARLRAKTALPKDAAEEAAVAAEVAAAAAAAGSGGRGNNGRLSRVPQGQGRMSPGGRTNLLTGQQLDGPTLPPAGGRKSIGGREFRDMGPLDREMGVMELARSLMPKDWAPSAAALGAQEDEWDGDPSRRETGESESYDGVDFTCGAPYPDAQSAAPGCRRPPPAQPPPARTPPLARRSSTRGAQGRPLSGRGPPGVRGSFASSHGEPPPPGDASSRRGSEFGGTGRKGSQAWPTSIRGVMTALQAEENRKRWDEYDVGTDGRLRKRTLIRAVKGGRGEASYFWEARPGSAEGCCTGPTALVPPRWSHCISPPGAQVVPQRDVPHDVWYNLKMEWKVRLLNARRNPVQNQQPGSAPEQARAPPLVPPLRCAPPTLSRALTARRRGGGSRCWRHT